MERDDLTELRHIIQKSARNDRSARAPCTTNALSVRRANKLVGQGLLEVLNMSEHIRGEKRHYFPYYRLTAAGLAVLEETMEDYIDADGNWKSAGATRKR